MNRDKQIEEMALDQAIRHADETAKTRDDLCDECRREHQQLADWLIELKEYRINGYRKSSEVAREIFEDIELMLTYFPLFGTIDSYIVDVKSLAELKKKYTEGEG